jgi:type IV pilus assembly protein PilX
MGTTNLQEKMAGNQKDRNLAFQAAETALVKGEYWIGSQTTMPIFDDSVTTDGLHHPVTSSATPPRWDDSANSNVWTGNDNVPFSGLAKVSSQPKYIIEDLGEIQDKGGSLVLPSGYKSAGKNLFRISARGKGGTDASTAMVQSTYEKRF